MQNNNSQRKISFFKAMSSKYQDHRSRNQTIHDIKKYLKQIEKELKQAREFTKALKKTNADPRLKKTNPDSRLKETNLESQLNEATKREVELIKILKRDKPVIHAIIQANKERQSSDFIKQDEKYKGYITNIINQYKTFSKIYSKNTFNEKIDPFRDATYHFNFLIGKLKEQYPQSNVYLKYEEMKEALSKKYDKKNEKEEQKDNNLNHQNPVSPGEHSKNYSHNQPPLNFIARHENGSNTQNQIPPIMQSRKKFSLKSPFDSRIHNENNLNLQNANNLTTQSPELNSLTLNSSDISSSILSTFTNSPYNNNNVMCEANERISSSPNAFEGVQNTSIELEDNSLDLRLVGIDGYDTYQAMTNSPKQHP